MKAVGDSINNSGILQGVKWPLINAMRLCCLRFTVWIIKALIQSLY